MGSCEHMYLYILIYTHINKNKHSPLKNGGKRKEGGREWERDEREERIRRDEELEMSRF